MRFPHDFIKYKPEVLASDQYLFNTPVAYLIAMSPILHSQCDTIKKSITDVHLLPTYPPGPTIILAILLLVPDPNASQNLLPLNQFPPALSSSSLKTSPDQCPCASNTPSFSSLVHTNLFITRLLVFYGGM